MPTVRRRQMPQHMAQALLPDPLPAPAPRRAHGSRGLRPAALRRCPHCAATQVRGAAGCSGEHFEHAEAAKAQRGRGTPAARRGRRTDAWCSSYRQLGFNNVGCAYQPPPRLASQLVGGLPPSRGQLKVTATHFDLRLPWPPGVGSENKAAGDGAAPPASTWAPKPNGLRERDGRTPTERQQRGGAYYNRVAVGGRCVCAGSRTASARQGQRSLPFARACHGIPAA